MKEKEYTAISIGPIIATLSKVRKPRHLWSASYLFSHLMKIIIEEGENEKLGIKLISPAKYESKENMIEESKEGKKHGIGLYPDRAFFEGKINLKALTENVLKCFSEDIEIDEDKLYNYFNIMGVCINASEESEAIKDLNRKLDILELANRCEESKINKEELTGREKVLDLISSGSESLLYEFAFEKGVFPVDTLAEIASCEIKLKYLQEWKNASNLDRFIENRLSEKQKKQLTKEDIFYLKLHEDIPEKLKSYHKYFCVVQADGDSMGKVIGNLQNGKMTELSESIVTFGKDASDKVKEFGGLPIYAGGDDLLFIAPAVSELAKGENKVKANIFDLIDEIDVLYQSITSKANELQKQGKKHTTSMSYGISINYYKYPLYEVLENARDLLFVDAKKNRNSIVCEFRKHSGSSLKFVLDKGKSQNQQNPTIKSIFEDLITIAVPENIVSAVAHKLRDNTALWVTTDGDKVRLTAFFKKIMGVGEKKDNESNYLNKVKELLGLFLEEKNNRENFAKRYPVEIEEYKNDKKIDQSETGLILLAEKFVKDKIENDIEDSKKNGNEQINQYIYSMLRTAKFINGEEVKDE